MKNTIEHYGIIISGGPPFVENTILALNLLPPVEEFTLVSKYIRRIQQSKRSGMRAYSKIPTYEVGEKTYAASTEWYASTIAHDAYHSYLFHIAKQNTKDIYPPDDTWTGKEAEKLCLYFQLNVLRQITDNKNLIKYLEEFQADPNYQNIPYKARDW